MNLSLILQVIGTAYPNVQQYIKHSTRSEHIIDTNRGYSDFSSNRRLSGFDVINKKHIITTVPLKWTNLSLESLKYSLLRVV